MNWNYRVILHDKDEDQWYGLHEVFYDDDGQVTSWTEHACRFTAYLHEGAGSIYGSLLKARVDAQKRPVLKESELLGSRP